MSLFCLLLLLAACGPESESAEPVADEPEVVLVPTFTPTPEQPTSEPTPISATPEPVPSSTPQAEPPQEPTPEPTLEPTPTPDLGPVAVVTAAGINVRGGPGTNYAQIGLAIEGDSFEIVGKNPAGDWWQICCVAGQPGWLYAPLVEAQNVDAVAVAAEIPAPPPTSAPVAEAPAAEVNEPAAPAAPAPAAAPPGQPAPTEGTAGNFNPNAQYQIVHFKVRGFDDNNGGIFNKGGQQFIFLNVLDAGGNPVDGVVVKNAVADNLTVVSGEKGPGKVEIKMDWDPYKLYVAQDGSGPVTSHVSNQMNNPYPHIPDIIGLLGPPDNEYAICPTPDDRCDPPFYHAHWSYEITFQRVN